MSLKYVFPCTGRSGSKYIQTLMTACGIKCGHEDVYRVANVFKDGSDTSTWTYTRDPALWAEKFEAESSHNLPPHLNDPPCQSAKVAHIVRHPLHVVDSWRAMAHYGSFPFMSHYCPFPADDAVSYCAGMYVAWNRYIEAQNWKTGRWVSDIPFKVEQPKYLLKTLGLSIITAPGEKEQWPATNINSIKSERITKVDDITDKYIRRAFIRIADDYGYEL